MPTRLTLFYRLCPCAVDERVCRAWILCRIGRAITTPIAWRAWAVAGCVPHPFCVADSSGGAEHWISRGAQLTVIAQRAKCAFLSLREAGQARVGARGA